MSDGGSGSGGSGGSGFNWGLRPSGDADEPEPTAPEPVTPEPVAPEPAAPEPAAPEPAAPWETGVTQLMPQPEPNLFATELFASEAAAPATELFASEAAAPATELFASEAAAPATELLGSSSLESDGADAGLDALFGESQFREYDTGVLSSDESPFAAKPASVEPGAESAAPAGISRAQRILISVAGGLLALLALVALFFVGTRLPALFAHKTPVASTSPSASPTPSSTAHAVGPVANGVHAWGDLLGGECLNPFTTPWAEKFTVVDCATPHPAQMVFRGTFDTKADPTFPGADKLQAQISLLCAAPGVINLAAAGAYSDAQVQGSYAVTEQEWADGEHDYFCFVSRKSGQPLTGSVALPHTPPTPSP